MTAPPGGEQARLAESPEMAGPWRQWGPYLAGRQWGTVREDYSPDGNAWGYFPFEQSHARAYRWGEDGLGGICDNFGFLNVAVALWNGQDDILKERLYGLTNPQGNHGEDVKEYWWVLDGTPTHSWMQWLYRYPQAAFPYKELREQNAARGKQDREYELADTGVLAENRFFDVTVSYAKAAPDDICITIEATNHGPDPAPLDLLPHVWFRNTWSWGSDERRPSLRAVPRAQLAVGSLSAVECTHDYLGRYIVAAEDAAAGQPAVLVCDNETNAVALFGSARNTSAYPKDTIGKQVMHGSPTAPDGVGTKAAFAYHFDAVAPGETVSVRLRLSHDDPTEATFGPGFDAVLADRRAEADAFYQGVLPADLDDEARAIARRAFAGLLWTKQLYRYDVRAWLAGDPAQPPAPEQRRERGARNVEWQHLALADVMTMPDEWEYPWFAAWDLAFHCVALAHVDPQFAKEQLVLTCREWAMHPDGQLPAYEWAFGDVNPPVHAWAAWQVYLIDGRRDTDFLLRVFAKLLLNFSWWVNREDADGSNLFSGGFLGMDNVGLFDRSAPLAPGYRLEQSDATSWMAFFCLSMERIALELARADQVWDDMATKFLEHFLAIAQAAGSIGGVEDGIWSSADGFCYDRLVHPDGSSEVLRVRSMVGLLPLLAVAVSEPWVTERLPDFTARLRWLARRRADRTANVLTWRDDPNSDPDSDPAADSGRATLGMLSLLGPERIDLVLRRMLDENCFLSPHGVRSLSAEYRTPYQTSVAGRPFSIGYEPAESQSALFGGNSNWRGPVWFPVNVLLIEALRAYGDALPERTVPFPTGSGNRLGYEQVAQELETRLIGLFRVGPDGRRPSDGARIESSGDPLWSGHLTFSEYFDADTGEGLGASHQTGWTALVAHLLCR